MQWFVFYFFLFFYFLAKEGISGKEWDTKKITFHGVVDIDQRTEVKIHSDWCLQKETFPHSPFILQALLSIPQLPWSFVCQSCPPYFLHKPSALSIPSAGYLITGTLCIECQAEIYSSSASCCQTKLWAGSGRSMDLIKSGTIHPCLQDSCS